jgi:hypothetical protein
MPLKHHTETFLVFLLAALIAVTGIVVSILPTLPSGLSAWLIAIGVAIVYPVVLLPLFRRNRADYSFRFLHWFPLAMLVVWGAFDVTADAWAGGLPLLSGFTAAWSLLPVFIGFALLVWFCIAVLRRKTLRLSVLGSLLGVFAIMGVTASQSDVNDAMRVALVPAEVSSSSSSLSEDGVRSSVTSSSSAIGGMIGKRVQDLPTSVQKHLPPVRKVSSSSLSAKKSSRAAISKSSARSVVKTTTSSKRSSSSKSSARSRSSSSKRGAQFLENGLFLGDFYFLTWPEESLSRAIFDHLN